MLVGLINLHLRPREALLLSVIYGPLEVSDSVLCVSPKAENGTASGFR